MSKNKKKRGLLAIDLSQRTKVIVVAAASVVIVLGIVIAALVVLANKTKPVDSAPLTAEQKRQVAIQDANEKLAIVTQAQTAMEHGDSNKVDAIYRAALKDVTDPTKKIQLLIDESRVYLYGGKYDKAIQAAKSAEPLSSDKYLAASWLAQVYYADKQYALAAQYYTLTGQWASSPNNIGRFAKANYDQQAASAQALVGASK